MKRDYLFHLFFLSLFVIVLWQFLCVLSPFLTPILAALVLVILTYPIHRAISRALATRHRNIASGLSTLVVTMLVIAPLLLIGWLLFHESQSMAPMLHGWAQAFTGWGPENGMASAPWLTKLESKLGAFFGIRGTDIQRGVIGLGSELFGTIAGLGRRLAAHTILGVMNLFIMVFTLFFFFRDGEYMFGQINRLTPMRAAHKEQLIRRLKITVTELVRGSIFTAACQATCATVGYVIVQVPGAMTLGVITGVASFIPVIGTSLIWAPMGIFFLVQGELWKGVFTLGWGAIAVSAFDNLLRAYFIGHKARLPTMFLFFGLIGGVRLYGLKGVLIGPLLVTVIPVFIEIYRDQYLRKAVSEPMDSNEELV